MKHRIFENTLAGTLVLELEGTATVAGLVEALEALFAHEGHVPGTPVLADARRLLLEHLNASEIWSVSSITKSFARRFGESRQALLVSPGPALDVARLYRLMTEQHVPMQMSVFSDLGKAQQWLQLGVPPAAAAAPCDGSVV